MQSTLGFSSQVNLDSVWYTEKGRRMFRTMVEKLLNNEGIQPKGLELDELLNSILQKTISGRDPDTLNIEIEQAAKYASLLIQTRLKKTEKYLKCTSTPTITHQQKPIYTREKKDIVFRKQTNPFYNQFIADQQKYRY